MRMVYVSGHSALEYDELRMFTDLGIECFALGAYVNPHKPNDTKRPAIPYMVRHPELEACLTGSDRESLPPELVDWADVFLYAALPLDWLIPNWERIKGKRVIWRTIGQSNINQEKIMKDYRKQGLQIVRYSPNERKFFEAAGGFAGEDAMIRFAKDPLEWYGWNGSRQEVGQVAQHDPTPHGRDMFTNWKWFESATSALPMTFAGSHSELIGGLGTLDYAEMKSYLRGLRAYCYTGTVPASYTLGLIEAMMTGVPVVSLTKDYAWAGEGLFEGDELASWSFFRPEDAWQKFRELLDAGPNYWASTIIRQRAIDLFGVRDIAARWRIFLND